LYSELRNRLPLVNMPVPLNESFEFCEELSNWIKVWRIWRQIHKLYSSIITYLRDPLCVMDGRIIHNKNAEAIYRTRKQLLDKILQDNAICGTFETRAKIIPSRVYAGKI
jgi:hypothetical protein